MTNVTIKKDLLKQALEAHRALREWIEAVPDDIQLPAMPGVDGEWLDEVEANLEAALAEPAVEPVGYASIEDLHQLQSCNGTSIWCESPSMWGPKEQAPPPPDDLVAIYTSPQTAADVLLFTDVEVGMLTVFDGLHNVEVPLLAEFVRHIEAAYRRKAGLK